jgi:hypothetical protein
LNPHLPFIYIPTPDWTHYAYEINNALGENNVECTYEGNYCKLLQPCQNVDSNWLSHRIRIQINDGEDDVDLYIPLMSLLAPGTDFDDSSSYCYIGIFMAKSGQNDLWEIGSKFFKDYYVVYDASVYQERGENMLLVGIAKKNQNANILRP